MTTVVQALGWYFPEKLGGTEIYVRALARRLRHHGYRVAIAVPDSRIIEGHSYEVEGVEVFRYPIPAFPNRAQAQGREPVPGVEALHRWLETKSPAIFHCHSLVTGLGLDELKVAKRLGARVIVTFHTPGLGYVCQRGTMMRRGRELCDGLAAPGKCTACVVSNGSLVRSAGAVLSKIPALEAHAVGTPVIGTRIGGLAEIIEDGVSGRLVTPGKPAALAAAIEEVVAAPRKTLAVWRDALPAPRTMDAIADDYFRLYGGERAIDARDPRDDP